MRPLRSLSSAAVAFAVLSVGSADAADTTESELRLNGWFPCGFSSSPTGPTSQDKPFECAEVDVPLCHEGVCESDRTISLFVKRVVANATEKAEVPKSLWMLQGGPGSSSVAFEKSMLAIHRHLNYQANLYTLDHRGTGRSFFLQCDAAQAFTSGSPTGVGVSADEMPNCLRDVLFQIDNQTAAFSVTNAAKDVEFLVNNLHEDNEEVYVYGASYGTYLSERLMHLAPSKVNGYILDGVLAEDDPSISFTGRNTDNVTPAKLLAKYCEQDKACAAMFGEFEKGDLYSTWQSVYENLDALKVGENKCADLFRNAVLGDTEPVVSKALKYFLAPIANDYTVKPMLPGLLHLVDRCQDDNDLLAIQSFKKLVETASGATAEATDETDEGETEDEEPEAPAGPVPQATDVINAVSPILSLLIKASELWAYPSPSWTQEMEVFDTEVFPQPMLFDFAFNCLLNGNLSDPSCEALDAFGVVSETDLSEIQPVQFLYDVDEYFEKFAKIPDHATAMVINGKLDFQTMSENGVRQYENMEGGLGKMMVEMDYGGHCTGLQATTMSDTTECGYRIIASYVEKSGDVDSVDTSCLEELPVLELWSADAIVKQYAPQPAAPATESKKAKKNTNKTKATKKVKKAKQAAFRHGK